MTRIALVALTLSVCAVRAQGRDISGTITTTLTVTEDSQLVGDVICALSGATCIVIGAPSVTLRLNGFTMTGEADPETGCGGGQITESGTTNAIGVTAQTDVNIQGPGLIQRFRGFGIVIGTNSARVKVTGVTLSTNCRSGIFVSGASDNELTGNVSIRNGSPNNPCGGI
jgi:hypothetical protein